MYIWFINSSKNMSYNTHGQSKLNKISPEYTAWNMMKQRCYNPKYPHYSYYGGKGITVCERWVTSFENFLEDMGKRPTPLHSLDRKNGELNYCKENCRWATKKEQSQNRKNVVMHTMEGLTMCGFEWSKYFGVTYQALRRYIKVHGFEKAYYHYKK